MTINRHFGNTAARDGDQAGIHSAVGSSEGLVTDGIPHQRRGRFPGPVAASGMSAAFI
jgi:hypothetical protein